MYAAFGVFERGGKKAPEIDEERFKALNAKIGEPAVANDFFIQKAQVVVRKVMRLMGRIPIYQGPNTSKAAKGHKT